MAWSWPLKRPLSRRGRLVLALLLVLLVAAFFRLWQIGSLPPGLFGDEATDGLDALDVLAGRGAVFFPANFGREGLHIWFVAGFFRLLGINALALRLPSVIAGILTALATFWLGHELAQALARPAADRGEGPVAPVFPWSWLGLLAALYLGTSYFHVHFSRFGIRGVFTPLCAALAFAAFWRGVNRPGRVYLWFGLSGLFLGLSLHFYTASRFLPIFLAGFLLLQAALAYAGGRREQAILVRHFGALALLVALAALVFAPLGLYFLQHPGSFSERAATVSAFKGGSPWPRIGQAALANLLQFFLPGRGDQAQFYNLPGRAVFDPVSAVLALIGVAALLYRWRQPAALFLLTWWPALLLPSFLATDRYPTLPRVLGTLPGVYFFPAAGLIALLVVWQRLAPRRQGDLPDRAPAAPGWRAWLPVALAAVALLVPAVLTYRDYFLVWGRSPATADAFEVDMAQAAGWLAANEPAGHVYLSSDIYRHPTFMLLYEHATVTRYFRDTDPNLSWFDARSVLPLPPRDQPATYLLAASAPPAQAAGGFLNGVGKVTERRAGNDGMPLLTVIDVPATAPDIAADRAAEPFSDRLALIGATWAGSPAEAPLLYLYWQTALPDPAGWPGYRLQVAGDGWQTELSFDDFRAPEWMPGGRFLTWRSLKLPAGAAALPGQLRLRLVTVDGGQPLTTPAAPDGWHTVTINPR
ncbi:MAG TPA: hypothetical protein VGA61_20360 [Anaerolineae bacterium]